MSSKTLVLSMALAGLVSSAAVSAFAADAAKGEKMGECVQSNECKGKGGCKGSGNECGGKNSCKGHKFEASEHSCKDMKGKWSAHKG